MLAVEAQAEQDPKLNVHRGEAPIVGAPSDAPTIYIDNLKGMQVRDGVIKLTFVENMHDPATDTLQARFAAHIAMPEKGFLNALAAMNRLASQMQELKAQANAPAAKEPS